MADSLDKADKGEDAEHHDALRDQRRDARLLRGLVKIEQIIGDHRRKQAHSKLRDTVSEDDLLRYFFDLIHRCAFSLPSSLIPYFFRT